jgi:hypothetical protein
MNTVKPWYSSATIWGGALALGSSLAGIAGYQVSPSDQAATVAHVTTLASALGGLLAIWGRVRASKAIGKP